MQNIGVGILRICGKHSFGLKSVTAVLTYSFCFLFFPLLLSCLIDGEQLTLTLKMTLHRLSKVWSLSTTINSPNQNYIHQSDQVPSNNDMTPGLASTVLSKRWLFL